MRPPLPWSFPLIQFSRTTTSSSPNSLSPCGALGFGDDDRRNLDPRGELPSLLLSLPLPLPPLPFPARAPFFSPACARPLAPSRAAPAPLAAWLPRPRCGSPAPRCGRPGPRRRAPRRGPLRAALRPRCAASAFGSVDPRHGRCACPGAARAACVASRPSFTQRVPACAAPRAR
jgi:hypothetical protein